MIGQNLPQPSDVTFLIIDDHELILNATANALQNTFPKAKLITASTAKSAYEKVHEFIPNLLLLDLSIPFSENAPSKTEVGLTLLEKLMGQNKSLNFTVLSSHLQRLITIIGKIENHIGGFTVVDKNQSTSVMVTRVEWALQGITYTKDIRNIRAGIKLRPEWFQVLKLAFEQGLQDKAIAEEMSISTRTVRVYFNKLQDALGIYPDNYNGHINLRIQTGIEARKMGLIEDVVGDN
ncbi:response regulator transcription factor [Leptothoe sp. EHU-05/26/07-4]